MKNQRRFVMTAITIIAVLCTEYSVAQLPNWKTDGNSGCGACIFGTTDAADLDFLTNNTQWMTLTTTGQVGIGTAVPGFKLHVEGGSDVELATGGFLVLGSTSSANVSFDDNEIEARSGGLASTLFLQNDGGDLNVSAGALFVQGSTNNVGIGNSAPTALLHVGTTTGARIKIGSVESIQDGGVNTLQFGVASLVPDVTLVRDIGTAALAWDDCNCDAFINISDRREKNNITPMAYGLNEVMKMKAVNYTMVKKPYEGNQIGFIAQDMLEVIPEVVKTTDWREDENGSMAEVKLDVWGIEYGKLVPVLVNAIQQQQTQIEELKAEVATLKNVQSVSGTQATASSGLEQNVPNPFTEKTTIRCTLPDNAVSGVLKVYDLKGNVVFEYTLHQTGLNEILIAGNTLPAGDYIYELSIDGKKIDSKKMTLTR